MPDYQKQSCSKMVWLVPGCQCPQMNVQIPSEWYVGGHTACVIWGTPWRRWLSGCGFGITLLIIQGPLDGADDDVRRDDRAWMFRSFFGSVETWQCSCLDFLGPWMAGNYKIKVSDKDSPSGMFWVGFLTSQRYSRFRWSVNTAKKWHTPSSQCLHSSRTSFTVRNSWLPMS